MEWKSCASRDAAIDAQLSLREAHIVQLLSDEVCLLYFLLSANFFTLLTDEFFLRFATSANRIRYAKPQFVGIDRFLITTISLVKCDPKNICALVYAIDSSNKLSFHPSFGVSVRNEPL